MRRSLWIGAALVVALAAAIPLWLVLDEGGQRRLGSIDPAAVQGQVGRLTIEGINGGAPLPIDTFTFRVRRPVGATQPEVDPIGVTLPLGTSMTQLVGRAATGAKAASAKVELVRSISGSPTAYLTFDLTGVSVDGFDDSYTAGSSGSVQGGAESIALRYDAMTMTCIPLACAEPTHTQGASTELAVQDVGTLAVRLEAGNFSVPKNLKDVGSIAGTATMELSYLVPALLSRAKDGKAFGKPVQIDLVRPVHDTPRKAATYKLGAAVVTSLAISDTSGDPSVVVAEFSSPHFGVTTYSYTATGVAEKPATFCFTSCTGL